MSNVEQLIETIVKRLEEQGYKLIGDFGREQLRLEQLEKCNVSTGIGLCGCSLDMELILHEKTIDDVVLIMFFDWINYVKPLDIPRCLGSTKISITVEGLNADVKVYEEEYSACSIIV